MSDYLANLAARECGPLSAGSLRPRLASVFESVPVKEQGALAAPLPIEVSASDHPPVFLDQSAVSCSAPVENVSVFKPARSLAELQKPASEPVLSNVSARRETYPQAPELLTSSSPTDGQRINVKAETPQLTTHRPHSPLNKGDESAERKNSFPLDDDELTISSPASPAGSNNSFSNVVASPAARKRSRPDVPQNGPAPTAPRIQVTIGRVDVRAILPPAPPQPVPKPAVKKVSLEDYLKRNGGRS
jgi:hypothetical protein